MNNNDSYNLLYIAGITLVSALGGFLFGYDWVVIGGAKPFYEVFFDIKGLPYYQGWAVSSALVGCIVGAVASGFLSDRFGRKNPLILSAILFTVSALGSGLTNEFTWFIIYRVLGGIGIGLASTLSPVYISEIAPKEYRGRLVSVNQLTIVLGILAAQIMNFLIAEEMARNIDATAILSSWNGQMGWRWMFWAELVPALTFLGLLFFVPQSPRFLVKMNQLGKAERILAQIGGTSFAQSSLHDIRTTLTNNNKKKSLGRLFDSNLLPIISIGIFLAVLQQWSGINVIFNYAEEIFKSAGYGVDTMFINIVITGSVNLLFTFVAMLTVDNWGRRNLMLMGTLGMAVTYIILGTAYYFEFTGWPIVLLVILAIAVYAMSLAPVTWVILAEIFPNRVRGIAMSVATFSLWIAAFTITFTFPVLNSWLQAYGTFWLYSAICLAGFVFIKLRLPETKGKSLEEIEERLNTNKS